ncbi:MAG: hypothetical protein Q7U36_04535 [bacterium]|nr:hypothetical protein [bacterium]
MSINKKLLIQFVSHIGMILVISLWYSSGFIEDFLQLSPGKKHLDAWGDFCKSFLLNVYISIGPILLALLVSFIIQKKYTLIKLKNLIVIANIILILAYFTIGKYIEHGILYCDSCMNF